MSNERSSRGPEEELWSQIDEAVDTSSLKEKYPTNQSTMSDEIIEYAYRDTIDDEIKPTGKEQKTRRVSDTMAQETYGKFVDTLDMPVADEIAEETYGEFLGQVRELLPENEQAELAYIDYLDKELLEKTDPVIADKEITHSVETLKIDDLEPGWNIVLTFPSDLEQGESIVILKTSSPSEELNGVYQCDVPMISESLVELFNYRSGNQNLPAIEKIDLMEDISVGKPLEIEIHLGSSASLAIDLPAPRSIKFTKYDSLTEYLTLKQRGEFGDNSMGTT